MGEYLYFSINLQSNLFFLCDHCNLFYDIEEWGNNYYDSGTTIRETLSADNLTIGLSLFSGRPLSSLLPLNRYHSWLVLFDHDNCKEESCVVTASFMSYMHNSWFWVLPSYSASQQPSSPPIALSSGMIEQVTRHTIDQVTTDRLLKDWEQDLSKTWPYNHIEDIVWVRNSCSFMHIALDRYSGFEMWGALRQVLTDHSTCNSEDLWSYLIPNGMAE